MAAVQNGTRPDDSWNAGLNGNNSTSPAVVIRLQQALYRYG